MSQICNDIILSWFICVSHSSELDYIYGVFHVKLLFLYIIKELSSAKLSEYSI